MSRSTLTNVLTADTYIANAISAGHPFEILTIDCKKVFDRAPHRAVLACFANLGEVGNSLCWFFSFLSEWTQIVKVGNSCSQISPVPCKVVQGNIFESAFFAVLLDTLLRQIHLQAVAFADDVKFISEVSVFRRICNQSSILKEIGRKRTICLSQLKNALSYITAKDYQISNIIYEPCPYQLIILLISVFCSHQMMVTKAIAKPLLQRQVSLLVQCEGPFN